MQTALAAVVAPVAALIWSSVALACAPGDIAVLQANSRVEGPFVHVAGEIKNGCTAMIGVELQAIFRKADGQIVHVRNFWPNSINNIPAGETLGYSARERLSGEGVTKVEIKVASVKRWEAQ